MLAEVLDASCAKSSRSFCCLLESPWHWSRCAMSAASSFRSTPIISVTMAMTSSKWPEVLTSAAIRASLRLPVRPEDACRREKARFLAAVPAMRPCPARLLREDESCIMVVAALPNVPDASSLVRTSSAFLMPISSSLRRFERLDHSSAFVLHEVFVSSKRASSASLSACVSSRSVLLSANSFALEALSADCFWRDDWSVASSAALVLMSSSNAF
mmetsp:Transcript_63390/g.138023  ORF Transcript_63390/g.138023 Transcript_63390/m.138023 type:complete len:215 (-) Transcript_63390:949-1593(-)